MKKIVTLAFVVITAISAMAQKPSNDELSASYNMLGIGYTSETSIGNGAYLQFMTARKIWDGLCADIGIKGRYTYWDAWGLADMHTMDARALLGLSYQAHVTKDFAVIPHTGANLGGRFELEGDEGGKSFVFGWDVGLRLRYKKVALTYSATIGITDMETAHSVGIAYGF